MSLGQDDMKGREKGKERKALVSVLQPFFLSASIYYIHRCLPQDILFSQHFQRLNSGVTFETNEDIGVSCFSGWPLYLYRYVLGLSGVLLIHFTCCMAEGV